LLRNAAADVRFCAVHGQHRPVSRDRIGERMNRAVADEKFKIGWDLYITL
jgi:hypothetical protein